MPTEGGIVVFVGPTLPVAEAEQLLSADFQPPVDQGAVLAAAERSPLAIVLIDGYFGWVPSVWHKEILWSLSEGIPVYGASSMGALRAAELKDHGMVGHGLVYRDYVEKRLEDDDEVALVHAGAEYGYRPLSDAMVNIRYTVADAVRGGVIGADAGDAFVTFGKAKFYHERRLVPLIAEAATSGVLQAGEAERLRSWVADHARDVKREDAVSLLRLLARQGPAPVPPLALGRFEATTSWMQLREAMRGRATIAPDGDFEVRGVSRNDGLRECSLAGDWPALEAMAALRQLAGGHPVSRTNVDRDEFIDELVRVSLAAGAADFDELIAWAGDLGWGLTRLSALVEREVHARRVLESIRPRLRQTAMEVLALEGRHTEHLERARAKARWLRANAPPADDPTAAATAVREFRQRVGAGRDVTDEALAARHGWESVHDMAEDLLIDAAYRHASD